MNIIFLKAYTGCYSGKILYNLAIKVKDSNLSNKDSYYELIAKRLIELENTFYASKFLEDIPFNDVVLTDEIKSIVKHKGINDFDWSRKNIINYNKAKNTKVSNPITDEELKTIRGLIDRFVIDEDIRALDVLSSVKGIPDELKKEIIFYSKKFTLETGAKLAILDMKGKNYSDDDIINSLQNPYLTEHNIFVKDLLAKQSKNK